ncbi:MAG TPA: GNAT family N-acetyltransferase [Thermoanaerobaculia bacterium]|nr:GNAT family N-acetyltransferase [Thermoanaerobaculia bacterium]
MSAASGRVRPAAEADLGPIVELHRRTFGAGEIPAAELPGYLTELFFRHPWRDERVPSLVYEEGPGELVGCLGVMPRPMTLDGEPVLAAVSHNFMVAPERRSTMAAVALMRALFAGPQDLSLAEGNDASRRVWTATGGGTSLLYSFRWTCPLRPARHAVGLLGRRGHLGPFAAALRPLAGLADLVAGRLPGSPLRLRPPALTAEELDAATLASCVERFSGRRALRPAYDAASVQWLFAALALRRDRGTLRKRLLKKAGGEVAGWYLYYARQGGAADVVQVGATGDTAGQVLDHLLDDARAHGATAVSGLMDPTLLPALSDRLCAFHRGRSATWLLTHSRNDRILRALDAGDAFFTHLEGEWWL